MPHTGVSWDFGTSHSIIGCRKVEYLVSRGSGVQGFGVQGSMLSTWTLRFTEVSPDPRS